MTNAIERRELRTGLEDWAGRPLWYRPHARATCTHYCEIHDHPWWHDDPHCIHHAAVPCPETR